MTRQLLVTCLLLASIAGCASQLPTHPQTDPQASLQTIVDRLRSISTIQSAAVVDFEEEGGADGVRLDAALAAQPPNYFRLRAWKLDQAVFDATLRDNEIWMLPSEPDASSDRGSEADIAARGVRRAFSFLSPALFENAVVDEGRTTPRELVVTVALDSSAPVRCTIDRDTLTPRHFVSLNPDADSSLSIDLEDYRLVSGTPWPHAWIISHDGPSRGRITIRMNDVVLNAELPPTAFVPPRRAIRNP